MATLLCGTKGENYRAEKSLASTSNIFGKLFETIQTQLNNVRPLCRTLTSILQRREIFSHTGTQTRVLLLILCHWMCALR